MANRRFEGLIHEGMVAFSADGEKLGKVRRVCCDTFEIEKGWLLRQHLTAACDEVLDVRYDDVFLNATTEALMARCAEDAGAATEEERVTVSAPRDQPEEPLRKAG